MDKVIKLEGQLIPSDKVFTNEFSVKFPQIIFKILPELREEEFNWNMDKDFSGSILDYLEEKFCEKKKLK